MLRGGADHHWARSQGEDSVPWSILSGGVLEPILGPPHPSWSSRAPRETGLHIVCLSVQFILNVRLDYRISYLLSVFKKEFVEVFPMQDSGADGTAPAFDSTSEPCFLPPPAVSCHHRCLQLPSPSFPLPKCIHCPSDGLSEEQGGTLPEWGSQDLTRVLVISHQELVRAWTSLGC